VIPCSRVRTLILRLIFLSPHAFTLEVARQHWQSTIGKTQGRSTRPCPFPSRMHRHCRVFRTLPDIVLAPRRPLATLRPVGSVHVRRCMTCTLPRHAHFREADRADGTSLHRNEHTNYPLRTILTYRNNNSWRKHRAIMRLFVDVDRRMREIVERSCYLLLEPSEQAQQDSPASLSPNPRRDFVHAVGELLTDLDRIPVRQLTRQSCLGVERRRTMKFRMSICSGW
jgi:hypothetical protein